MVEESNQNVFLIEIDASRFSEFETSEFEIARVDCEFEIARVEYNYLLVSLFLSGISSYLYLP